MRQYEMYEMAFKGTAPENSYVEVELQADFRIEDETITVKGFYAGNDTYKIRFYPSKCGCYHYQVHGIAEAEGDIECKPAEGAHGIVYPHGTHFQYGDGSWYYPFGTTVYALVHQPTERIRQTLETLREATFNKIRICVFPKYFDFNHEEPECFPFERNADGEWDVQKPFFEFWDRLDDIIKQLDGLGIQCDLILFHPYDKWGFSQLSREQGRVYLEYLVRRLSALPNLWWSLANEYDIMAYQKADWEYFAAYLHENDVYGHLLSNHNMIKQWDFSNKDTTHVCLQIKRLDEISRQIAEFQKPCMVDECCYEGNISFEWGNISAFEMVDRFWKTCVQGAYCTHGETFLCDDEVLWWSKGGVLKGESPERIAFLRNIIESLPGPLMYSGHDMTEEEVVQLMENPPEELKNSPFARLASEITWPEIKQMMLEGKVFGGQAGEEAYLIYYSHHCNAVGVMELPTDNCYDVEVIDVWEMTRKTVQSRVNGHIEVRLPGKEGIALMALQCKN